MNQIQAKHKKSKHSNKSHLTIHVDGKSLDKILHEIYPDKNLIGLVPTFLNWPEDTKERELILQRFESEEKQVVPILMCPDTVNLRYKILHVEIEKTENSVKWLRIGLGYSRFESNSTESMKTTVEWLSKIELLEFDRIEYQKFVSEIKAEIEKEEIKRLINFWITRINDKELIPHAIKAFNFGIIETENDYQMYLVGAHNYDTLNDDWACEEDFIPKEKYLSLGTYSKKWRWEEIQSIVKSGIEQFMETKIFPLTFVHKAEFITTGFDDGELQQVKQPFGIS